MIYDANQLTYDFCDTNLTAAYSNTTRIYPNFYSIKTLHNLFLLGASATPVTISNNHSKHTTINSQDTGL